MTCDQVRPQLGELLVGALDATDSEALLQHVEACVACGRELAELQALEDGLKLAAGLPAPESADRSEAPPRPVSPPTPRIAPWKLWIQPAIAAAILAVVILGRVTPTSASQVLLVGKVSTPTEQLGEAAELPIGVPLTVDSRASIALPDGSVIAATPGTRLELTGRRAVRLTTGRAAFRVAKDDTPFAVLTPRGTARVLGTTFRLEVKETEMKQAVKASAVATIVTLAVASGVVLFVPDSGDSVRVEAGEEIVAGPDGVDLLDTTESPPAELEELRQRKAALEEKGEALNAKLAELEAKLAASQEEVAKLEATLEEQRQASGATPAKPKKLAVEYGNWSESDVLKDADWKEMGGAYKTMLELMPELYEVLRAGEKPPTELTIKFSRENTKLLKFAIEAMGKLPTSTNQTGNGSFTHPIVTSNLLVEHLEQAGEPLSEAQMWTLHRLGAEYDAGWDAAQAGYTEQTYALQRLTDELTLKRAYYDGMVGMLTPAQNALVVNPEFQHVSGIDVYSPVLMLTGVAQPSNAASLEVMKANLINTASAWGFDDEALAGQGIVFDTWISDLGELTPYSNPMAARFVNLDDSMRAVRAQLKAMQELEARLAPNAATQKALREAETFTVPRLLAQ